MAAAIDPKTFDGVALQRGHHQGDSSSDLEEDDPPGLKVGRSSDIVPVPGADVRMNTLIRIATAVLLLLAASHAQGETQTDERLAAQARGLLHRWLAAQNSGDFDLYQALYAPGFRGVRRSGQRTVRLGQRDWLRDRRRMFAKPQRVAASAVEVSPHADGTVDLHFTQSYRSGSYEDEGSKHLALIPAGEQLAIFYEELLSLRARSALGEARMVADSLIILEMSPPRSLGGGNPVGEPSRTQESVEAFQEVDASKLPARFAREVGRRYHILDFAWPERAPCEVRVTHLRIWYRGRVETEYGAPQAAATPPLDLAADGQRLLVAVSTTDGECPCRSGLAYPATLPLPAVAKGEPMSQATHLQVLEAIAGVAAQLPPGFPTQLDLLKARCRLLGAERFYAVEAGVASDLLLHYAECENHDGGSASLQCRSGPSQRYMAAKTTRFWSLWSMERERLSLRDAGVDAQRLLGRGPWTGVDLNGDGRLDFFGLHQLPEWVGPGQLKSAVGDAALFSSGAGYTLGPRSVAPPPVLLWEPEPGC